MRPTQKNNRTRGRGNRKSNGNNVNRVYDSSGPEGKVRGTPQQIIDKYLSLARDAQTSGDRVMAENFLQHAEHYQRILILATAGQAEARREAPQPDVEDDGQPELAPAQAEERPRRRDREREREPEGETASEPSVSGMAMIEPEGSDDSLLMTPAEPAPVERAAEPAAPAEPAAEATQAPEPATSQAPDPAPAPATAPAPAPRRRRGRPPKSEKVAAAAADPAPSAEAPADNA